MTFISDGGEMVNVENDDIIMVDRMTGKKQKCNINDLCSLIKTIFPDKEEQKELLQEMFRRSF